jgi:hypothetical protein
MTKRLPRRKLLVMKFQTSIYTLKDRPTQFKDLRLLLDKSGLLFYLKMLFESH